MSWEKFARAIPGRKAKKTAEVTLSKTKLLLNVRSAKQVAFKTGDRVAMMWDKETGDVAFFKDEGGWRVSRNGVGSKGSAGFSISCTAFIRNIGSPLGTYPLKAFQFEEGVLHGFNTKGLDKG